MDYAKRPIIIVGANHSGTRVLVEMLDALGSSAGRIDNEWRESELFLQAHRLLVGTDDPDEWERRIFDLQFLGQARPSPAVVQELRELIRIGVPHEFPTYQSAPWHWKCPTSTFFLDLWREIFPDAYVVHITRDPLDVARSLITRRQFYSLRRALRFCQEVEERIGSAGFANYLHLDYSTLGENLGALGAFVPGLRTSSMDQARSLLRETSPQWKPGRSLQHNLWMQMTALRIELARRTRSATS